MAFSEESNKLQDLIMLEDSRKIDLLYQDVMKRFIEDMEMEKLIKENDRLEKEVDYQRQIEINERLVDAINNLSYKINQNSMKIEDCTNSIKILRSTIKNK